MQNPKEEQRQRSVLANRSQESMGGAVIYHSQVQFIPEMQGWVDIGKLIVYNLFPECRTKTTCFSPLMQRKHLNKNSVSFHDKNTQQTD